MHKFLIPLLLICLLLIPFFFVSAVQTETLIFGFYGDAEAARGLQLAAAQINTEPFVGADGVSYQVEVVVSENPAMLADAVVVLAQDGEVESTETVTWAMPVILLSPDAPLTLHGIQVFRGMTSRTHMDDMLMNFLLTQSAVQRAMLIGENLDDYALRLSAAQGVQIQQQESVLLTADDFQAVLSFSPQVIFYSGDAVSAATLIRELHNRAWTGFFVYSDLPALAAETDFIAVSGIRVIGAAAWVNSAEDDLSRVFTTSYITEYGEAPDAYDVTAYDLGWAMRLMVGRVGANPADLANALPTTALIRTTHGDMNPARYGGTELYQSVMIYEQLSANRTAVLARYDGGALITLGQEVVAFPTATLIPSPTPSQFVFTVTSGTLNVRSGPGEAYDVIGQLSRDEQVTILGRLEDGGWYLVQSPFGLGWVVARFGQVFDPGGVLLPELAPPPPPTPTPLPTQPVMTPSSGGEIQVIPDTTANSTPSSGFELGGQVKNQENIDLMRAAGMTWIKEQVRWELGETPAKAAQGAVEAARANGMKILISSVGWSYEMGDLESYMNQYADYLRGVAALGPDAIEVWNEPNIDREWPQGSINGETYTRLLQKAYSAIKSANPNVMVISAALAPTGFFGGGCATNGCDDDVFLRQMAQAGAANYMDCIGVHHNEGAISPEFRSGDSRGTHHSYYFPAMIDLYSSTFGGALPLCFTEVGYLASAGYDALPPAFGWASHITVENQADWLAQAVKTARQNGRVRLLVVWNVNFTTTHADDPRGGFAIIRPDGSCPACSTLGAVMR